MDAVRPCLRHFGAVSSASVWPFLPSPSPSVWLARAPPAERRARMSAAHFFADQRMCVEMCSGTWSDDNADCFPPCDTYHPSNLNCLGV